MCTLFLKVHECGQKVMQIRDCSLIFLNFDDPVLNRVLCLIPLLLLDHNIIPGYARFKGSHLSLDDLERSLSKYNQSFITILDFTVLTDCSVLAMAALKQQHFDFLGLFDDQPAPLFYIQIAYMHSCQ